MKRPSTAPRKEERKRPRTKLKSSERNALLFECLAWVNEQREAHSLPKLERILPGVRRSWHYCPIARSLALGGGETVSAATWAVEWHADGKEDPLLSVCPPDAVRKFIEAFDCDGEFGELETNVTVSG